LRFSGFLIIPVLDITNGPPPGLDPPDQSTKEWRDLRTMTEQERDKIITYLIDNQCGYVKAYELHGFKHFCDLMKMKAPSEAKEDTGDHWYFVTLTQPDSDKTWTRIDKSVKRILNSKQVKPLEWCYVRELTASATPHIHMRLRVPDYLDFRVIRKFNDNYRIDVQLERAGCYNYLVQDNKVHPTGEWFYSSQNYTGPRPSEQETPREEGPLENVPDEILNATENILTL